MGTRTVRLGVSAAAIAAAALALSACSSGAGSSAGASASTGSGAASGASATSGSGSGASTASGAGSAALQAQSASQNAALRPCASGQLKVGQADAGVGAGQYYSKLVFTNVSGSTCTLTGYPGVSYVKAGGVQSGNPAQRSGGAARTVTLRPHASASAVLHDSNGLSGYDPQQCQLSWAEGLRIYPPNQKAALFLPWKTQHCAGTGIHPLTIGPVQG